MFEYEILGNTVLGDAASDAAAAEKRRQILEAAGTGIQAASEWVSQGLQYKAQQDATKRSAGEEQQSIARAVAADRVATDAAARALHSAETKSPTAAADQAAAVLSAAVQDQTAALLSPDGQRKRGEEARAAVEKAIAEWQASAKDPIRGRLAELKVQAAKLTFDKTQGALVAHGQQPLPPPDSGFLSPKAKTALVIGGVTVGLATVGFIAYKAFWGR